VRPCKALGRKRDASFDASYVLERCRLRKKIPFYESVARTAFGMEVFMDKTCVARVVRPQISVPCYDETADEGLAAWLASAEAAVAVVSGDSGSGKTTTISIARYELCQAL
jgi:Tfp pilus assembly pilus retraction ATPase PilT